MQIVIEISEEMKDTCDNDAFEQATNYVSWFNGTLVMAIKNGTPLPEGHGRLIDADAFIKNRTEISCENCDRRRGMKNGKLKFVYEIGGVPCRACDIGDMIDCVDDAEVVIPADKGDEE